MRGYTNTSYGDGFADVYDEWYETVTDIDATVEQLTSLAPAGARVLELGVGTGRLAIPLAAAGFAVVGIDSSRAMLDQLEQRVATTTAASTADDGSVQATVEFVHGDMVTDLPDGPFDVALVAYNTIFNLVDHDAQAACFSAVAQRLTPGGVFVVEAFVPDVDAPVGSDIGVRSMAVDHVVLSVSRNEPDAQRASGQFVEISEAGGVRLRPWSIRWSTPDQLDEMAAASGLRLEHRYADMAGEPFTDESDQHVSIYRTS